MTALSPIDQTFARLSPRAMADAIEPFTVAAGDGLWLKTLNRRRLRTMKRVLGRYWGKREKAAIEKEYTRAWAAGYGRYRLDRADLKPVPWKWGERRMLLDPAAAGRMRAMMFAGVLRELKPSRVLEVGCGNGINLFALAGAFPDIEFSGVDLTAEGIEQANAAQKDEATLDILRRYSPLDIADPAALKRIRFLQADATALPFADGAFDLVLTVLAVEQMERVRHAALSEIARVTSGHALMLEPFRDVNDGGLRRIYVFARDYFRGAIADLPRFGLQPVWATDDFPQEAFLGAALVLSRKAPRQ